jgi:hypothetical protein
MKARKPIPEIRAGASRWMRWANDLRSRTRRRAQIMPAGLLWRLPILARFVNVLQQQNFFSSMVVQPRLHYSFLQQRAWNNRSTNFFQRPTLNFKGGPSQTGVARFRPEGGAAPRPVEMRLMLEPSLRWPSSREATSGPALVNEAMARLRTENVATRLEQQFRVNRELQLTEVSRLLTERTRRIVGGAEDVQVRQPMTLHSEMPVSKAGASSRQPTIRDWDVDGKTSRVDVGAAAMPVGALDVERLTSEVMKQIDRRVIARRERLGQI